MLLKLLLFRNCIHIKANLALSSEKASVQIQSSLNMEIYKGNLHIHYKYNKIKNRKNFVFGLFSRSEFLNDKGYKS